MLTEFPLAVTDGYTSFWAEPSLMFWSAVLRMSQAVIAASPFLLTGMLVTGILRGMLGAPNIRRLFGVGHWTGPIRGWFLGILLPICSLGALPIARELRRAGVSSATVLSFVLVAPVLNPISILYGISHITLTTLAYFIVGTMIVSLGIGFIWQNLVSRHRDEVPEDVEQPPRSSLKRLAVTGITTTRGMLDSLPDVGLAILAVGLLGAFIPYGIMQDSMTRDNVFATAIVGGVAIPAYVTPFEVMVQYGLIVRDGYSLGAAFALIVLGAGANVGVANWIRREYRYRALGVFLLLLLGTTLVLGFTADRIIHDGPAQVSHTHAFDGYARLSFISKTDTYLAWYLEAIAPKLTRPATAGLSVLGLLLLVGVALRLVGDRASVEAIIQSDRDQHDEPAGALERPVSTGVIVAGSSIGLLATIGLSLFIVFPSPSQLTGEADVIRLDLYEEVRTENHDEINRRIEQMDSRVRKIPIAAWIRGNALSPEAEEAVGDVVHLLELLRRYNVHGQYPQAATLVQYLDQQYKACRRQVTESASPKRSARAVTD